MGSFGDTTKTIMSYLEGNGAINTVSFGDANEFDLSKNTTYPYAHLIPVSTSLSEGYTTYNYQILFTDIYRSSKDDKIDIMDGMSVLVEQLHKSLHRGQLFDNSIRTAANSTAEPIYDERQNRVYGFSLTISVTVPAEIDICV